MGTLPRLAFGNAGALEDYDVRRMNDRIRCSTGFEIAYHVAGPAAGFRHRSAVALINGLSVVATASTPLDVEVSDAERPALLVPIHGRSHTVVDQVSHQWNAGEAAMFLPATARRGRDTARSALFITIDEERLQATARSMLAFGPDGDVSFLALQRPRTIDMHIGDIDFDKVFRHFGEVIDQFANAPNLLDCSALDEAFYRTLVMMLAPEQFILADDSGNERRMPLSDQRLDVLCEYILAHLEQTLTMTNLETFSGVTARSIQYAFARRFGCTPGQWVQEQKLRAVHHLLSTAGEDVTVTRLAQLYFSNLGDFSRKYRQRFGELPSQTLAKARK